MSKYTTQLRFICENYSGLDESTGLSEIDSIIAGSRAKIFDFDYPIWDDDYKSVLESKFIARYYTREICAETVGRWKLFLRDKFNEIMPYYNDMYRAALADVDPYIDVNLVTEHSGNGTDTGSVSESALHTRTDNLSNSQTSHGQYNGSNISKNMFSDTPQGGLNGLLENNYMSSATVVDGQENSTNSNTISGTNTGTVSNQGTTNNTRNLATTDEYIHKLKGKTGSRSYASMLMELRKSIINIDKMILDECQDLFFGLY